MTRNYSLKGTSRYVADEIVIDGNSIYRRWRGRRGGKRKQMTMYTMEIYGTTHLSNGDVPTVQKWQFKAHHSVLFFVVLTIHVCVCVCVLAPTRCSLESKLSATSFVPSVYCELGVRHRVLPKNSTAFRRPKHLNKEKEDGNSGGLSLNAILLLIYNSNFTIDRRLT